MRKAVLWIVAVMTLANGAFMALAAEGWWATIPDVGETGAFNAHFVRDVGAAYVGSGIGLAWFALRPAQRAAALVALVFLSVHALFHVLEFVSGHGGGGPAAVLGVVAPSVIVALVILWPQRATYATGEA
jgi:hypothetical protein